jgi:3-hydroxybutyryl-CoA dehydratase
METRTLVISQADVKDYAHLSHDHNPLHVDQEQSSKGPFRRTIAHGTIACAVLQDLYYRSNIERPSFVPIKCTFKFLSPLYPDVPTVFEMASATQSKGECQVRAGDKLILVGRIQEIEHSGL